MIARNEAASIAKALQSIRPFVDQMIVLDTGSDDTTAQIAIRMGAEVHFTEWRDNFSLARNQALTLLRTDWVLHLDADEEADGNSFMENLHLLQDPECGGITVQLINKLQGGAESIHRYTRLFRRHPGISYQGAIHEQIAASIIATGYKTVDSQISIIHYGYSQPEASRHERNITLLRHELELSPEDDWLAYHLGLTCWSAGRMHEAVPLLQRCFDSAQLSVEQLSVCRLRLAQCLLGLGHTEQAESIAQKELPDKMNKSLEGLRLFICGACAALRGDFLQAAMLLSQPETDESGLLEIQKLHDMRQTVQTLLTGKS
jgi:tetratricopeptide (TPR) repeat protein